MTFDLEIGDRHWGTAFRIFDRSDDIVHGLESVIGGCHDDGVVDYFVAVEKAVTVCVEFCHAFVVDWYAEEPDEVADEACSCHSSLSFYAKRLNGIASRVAPSFPQYSFPACQNHPYEP
jgi:hypothetical protein